MEYSTFSKNKNDALLEPMFLGQAVNVQRYDQAKYPIFNELTEKQKSFFWRPEEIDIARDRRDFATLPEHEKHIFLSNLKYQCLVEGTEVLTQKGWVDLTIYDGKSPILIYDLEKEQTKWEVPVNKFTRPHKGIVYEFKSNVENQFIQVVTPEHRMPYIARKSNAKYFVEAKDMVYSNTKQAPISGEFIDGNQNELTALERLIIATQADGSVYERYTGTLSGTIPVYFSFSKPRKIKRIVEIANACGFEVQTTGVRQHKPKFAKDTTVFKVKVPVEFKPHTWKNFADTLDLTSKTANWCKEFIEECVLWDGSTPKDSQTAKYYCTTEAINADFVQAVATLAGYSPRHTVRSDKRKAHYKDLHTIRFINKRLKNGESIGKTEKDYDGNVSCVTVSTGAFVIRYKNTVSVTGNCLLDSVQGRAPAVTFLPLISIPELEHWTVWWTAIEALHSFSYTHIIRNILNDPSEVFDDIVVNEAILKRAEAVSKYYDDLLELQNYYNLLGEGRHEIKNTQTGEHRIVEVSKRELMKRLYLCLFSVNALEAIRFYVSFVCSFSFAERSLMEGNAKIIKLISRDEALHLTVTQHMINILKSGREGELWKEITEECEEETYEIFKAVVDQEKEWCKYLFKDGSVLGLNEGILIQYLEFIANHRMLALGMTPLFPNATSNPIPWINAWLTSDNVQVAPQEVEITSYVVGQINAEVSVDDFENIEI